MQQQQQQEQEQELRWSERQQEQGLHRSGGRGGEGRVGRAERKSCRWVIGVR
jgi:hypothetical protein